MTEVTLIQLLEQLDPETQKAVLERATQFGPQATHVVLFENIQLDSSSCGQTTVLFIGPGCTYRDLDGIRNGHLNDLPSQRQYPRIFAPLVFELDRDHYSQPPRIGVN